MATISKFEGLILSLGRLVVELQQDVTEVKQKVDSKVDFNTVQSLVNPLMDRVTLVESQGNSGSGGSALALDIPSMQARDEVGVEK